MVVGYGCPDDGMCSGIMILDVEGSCILFIEVFFQLLVVERFQFQLLTSCMTSFSSSLLELWVKGFIVFSCSLGLG